MKTNTKFSKAQKFAVYHEADRILVIAGAGSGKTRVTIERILLLIERGTEPEKIIAITFTNEAAAVMRKRLEFATPGLGDRIGFLGTLHAFLLKLLRENYADVGLGSALYVIDEEAKKELVAEIIEEHRYKGSVEEVFEKLKLGVAHIRALTPPTKAENVAKAYFNRMIERCALDFDMILEFGAMLVRIDSLKSCGGIARGFSHLFVDEVQDSGDLDFEIYEGLNIPNKFLVGDSDQAIFGFRGGNVENILRIATPGSGWQTLTLEINYRSTKEVCRLAQGLIQKNVARFRKRTIPATKITGKIELHSFSDDYAERGFIGNDILKEHGTGKAPFAAVLCRSNRTAREFARHLEAIGVPVAKKETFNRPADWKLTKDAINFLVNPDNDAIAIRMLAAMYGKTHADAKREAALKRYKTINQVEGIAEYDTPLAHVTTFLSRRLAIGVESRQRVSDLIDTLPHSAELPDLALAIAKDENHNAYVGEGVVCTTIHSAKGREFGTVFLPACEQEIIPEPRSNIEEERRLLYVGITRAINRVVITHARRRAREFPRQNPEATPSIFFKELEAL